VAPQDARARLLLHCGHHMLQLLLLRLLLPFTAAFVASC
jgi:hypothetical protein